MRNDLNASRTSACFASALAFDPEPLAKHSHAVENLPITVEPLPKSLRAECTHTGWDSVRREDRQLSVNSQ